MRPVAFVAGATGYTGRHVVEELRARRLTTHAHVRPDSKRLEMWRERFRGLGAEVDTTPWNAQAMGAAIERLQPTIVFALLGTTRARADFESDASYEAVDYGLTRLLLDAVRAHAPAALFVYLSAIGARESTRNRYLAVRGRLERELRESGLRHLVARPAFISGDDRDEPRPVERLAARILDGALAMAARMSGSGLRDRYASLSGSELGRGLVRLALTDAQGVVGPSELRAACR